VGASVCTRVKPRLSRAPASALGFREEVEGAWKKLSTPSCFVALRGLCGRQRVGRGGFLPPLLLAAKLRKGVAVRRDPSNATLREQRLLQPRSEREKRSGCAWSC